MPCSNGLANGNGMLFLICSACVWPMIFANFGTFAPGTGWFDLFLARPLNHRHVSSTEGQQC